MSKHHTGSSRGADEPSESFVYAIFPDEPSAARAVQALLDAHFSAARVGALMRRDGELEPLSPSRKTGVGVGASLGAVLGSVGGVLVASGGLLVAGPLVLLAEAALAGGAFGALAGALGGLGYWKDEIDFPDSAFDAGAVLLGVETVPGRVQTARQALLDAGAAEVRVSERRKLTGAELGGGAAQGGGERHGAPGK